MCPSPPSSPTRTDPPASALVAAVAAAPTGIVIADPRLPDCPLVFVNPAFLRMTGYDEAEVLGRNCRFLQGPRTDPKAVAALREAIAARRPITIELLNHRKDGRPFVNELHVGPVFDAAGMLTAFIGIQHDVTERANAIAATRRARRAAERANAAKSEMLAFVAHEIRTPLAGSLGALGLLADTGLSPAQRRLLDTARMAGEAMRTTLEDILDLSRAEAGRLALADIAFDPRRVLEEVAATLVPAAEAKGLTLSASADAAVPAAIRGDPARLRQVLLNLADNAVTATAEGRVAIRLSVRDARLLAEVTDTGPGIPPALRRRLFRRHVQGEGAERGAGLGLTICRRLVRLMGGRIALDAAPGGGARFRVDLPLAPAEAADPQPHRAPPAAPPRAVRRRVLLVEDSPAAALAAATVLRKAGHEVEEARGAEAALAAARARPPDTVVLDLGLPGGSGLELARALADLAPGVPRIALTGSPERAAGQGFAAVLGKPADPVALLSAVAGALAGAPPLADPAVLADLSAAVGPARLAALVALFAEETEGRLARLAARPPWPEVEAEAHGLASAAATFGCAVLADRAAALEAAAAAGRKSEAEALLAELPPLVARTLSEIGAGRRA
ncbi:MAG: ATP-binding protein [Acetobacteraceae bacterium]